MYDVIVRQKMERLFVEEGLDVNTIFKKSSDKIKRNTLHSWCKRYEWKEKRKKYLSNPVSREERINSHIDATLLGLLLSSPPGEVSDLSKYANALRVIHAVDEGAGKKKKPDENPKSKNLSVEAVREIEKKLFGFDYDDPITPSSQSGVSGAGLPHIEHTGNASPDEKEHPGGTNTDPSMNPGSTNPSGPDNSDNIKPEEQYGPNVQVRNYKLTPRQFLIDDNRRKYP